MDTKVEFFFYLAAVIVFVLAAMGNGFSVGKRGMVLVPLGLALWLFPTLWNVGEAAF
ncbi:MAG: hypothetical protein K8R99_06485 [Actinomycetia bacterium]|nr:hypothetical protein [Actinomycetes bacterium]